MVIEIQTETWYVIWTVIIAIVIILVIVSIKFRQKYIDALNQLDQRGKESHRMGINQFKGGINEILGTFSLITEYDDLILLSTTSGNASMDLIGIKPYSLDFIELKTKGAGLTKNEKKIRRLVQEKKVEYRIVDVELPSDIKIDERKKI